MRIVWGPVATPGEAFGYGVIGEELQEALKSAGAELVPASDFDWDVAVICGLPMGWMLGQGLRQDLCFHTMYEAYPIPPGWARVLNRVGLVWVPSNWVKQLFQDGGIRTPIFVAGYGVNHEVFYPVDRGGRDGPLRFVAWGRAFISRKNLMLALRAFVAAGLPPSEATLEIKVNATDLAAPTGVDGHPEIRIIREDWRRFKIADWLRAADCLIYPSASEGWGMMVTESMATGLPVIAAYHTGMLDFLTPDNCLPVPCAPGEPATSYRKHFGHECFWYRPDFDALVARIRWAFEHRAELYAIGQRGQETVAPLTWHATGVRALAQLAAHYG